MGKMEHLGQSSFIKAKDSNAKIKSDFKENKWTKIFLDQKRITKLIQRHGFLLLLFLVLFSERFHLHFP